MSVRTRMRSGSSRMGSVRLMSVTTGASISPPRSRSTTSSRSTGLTSTRGGTSVRDDEFAEGTKARYKFPYGDFEKVHRCGVLAAESRAGQYKYLDVEAAAAHLHGMLEGLR